MLMSHNTNFNLITPADVARISSFGVSNLEKIAKDNGYDDDYIMSTWAGLTKSGKFAFRVVFYEHDSNAKKSGMIYLSPIGNDIYRLDY